MSWARHALRRVWRWLPQRWAPAADVLPPAGSAQAQARCGPWALAWASRAGPHHLNQDCAGARWRHLPDGAGLAAAVADGVTHGAAGDVAALALVQHWLQGPQPPQRQRSFLGAAEAAVASALRRLTREPGAATGAACWLQPDGSGWATRVGDCRLLRVQPPAAGAWSAQPLLPDQTYAELSRQGAGATLPAPDDAGQPACMVGVGSLGEPEWVPLAMAGGDLLLLVSDGLHSALSDSDWQHLLATHLGAGASGTPAAARPQARLLALAEVLIQTAIQRGSEDDITVLAVMRCTHPRPEEPQP